MKKLLMCLFFLGCLIFGLAGTAGAIPIGFDIDEARSSASVLGSWVGPITSSLDGDLDSRIFSLGDGESHAFNFVTLSVQPSRWGFGRRIPLVEAALAFEAPAGAKPVIGNGDGWWFTGFGALSGGTPSRNDSLPQTVIFASGDSFVVDFSDIFVFGIDNSATVGATVTAHAASPVPEPATMLLLGLGLVGLAGLSRRKFRSA